MFGRLLVRSHLFFDLFDRHAALTLIAAQELYLGFANEISKFQSLPIKSLERQANEITRQCTEALHRTFITPFDREEIYRLICRMDTIIDCIDKVANRLVLYKIQNATNELLVLTTIVLNAVLEVEKAVKGLRNLKQRDGIQRSCEEIIRFEHEANVTLREAIGRLFEEEQDARQIIKWKEIYECLEEATNCCAIASSVITGILLEYD